MTAEAVSSMFFPSLCSQSSSMPHFILEAVTPSRMHQHQPSSVLRESCIQSLRFKEVCKEPSRSIKEFKLVFAGVASSRHPRATYLHISSLKSISSAHTSRQGQSYCLNRVVPSGVNFNVNQSHDNDLRGHSLRHCLSHQPRFARVTVSLSIDRQPTKRKRLESLGTWNTRQ